MPLWMLVIAVWLMGFGTGVLALMALNLLHLLNLSTWWLLAVLLLSLAQWVYYRVLFKANAIATHPPKTKKADTVSRSTVSSSRERDP